MVNFMSELNILKTETYGLRQFLTELKLLKKIADEKNANVIITTAIRYETPGKNSHDIKYGYSVEFKAMIDYGFPDRYENNISGKLQKIRDWYKTKQGEMRYTTQKQVYESSVGELTSTLTHGKKEKLIAALKDAKNVVTMVNHEGLKILAGGSEFDCHQVYDSIKEKII